MNLSRWITLICQAMKGRRKDYKVAAVPKLNRAKTTKTSKAVSTNRCKQWILTLETWAKNKWNGSLSDILSLCIFFAPQLG